MVFMLSGATCSLVRSLGPRQVDPTSACVERSNKISKSGLLFRLKGGLLARKRIAAYHAQGLGSPEVKVGTWDQADKSHSVLPRKSVEYDRQEPQIFVIFALGILTLDPHADSE